MNTNIFAYIRFNGTRPLFARLASGEGKVELKKGDVYRIPYGRAMQLSRFKDVEVLEAEDLTEKEMAKIKKDRDEKQKKTEKLEKQIQKDREDSKLANELEALKLEVRKLGYPEEMIEGCKTADECNELLKKGVYTTESEDEKNIDEMTAPELKKYLDDNKVKYKSSLKVDELRKLVIDHASEALHKDDELVEVELTEEMIEADPDTYKDLKVGDMVKVKKEEPKK